MNKELAITIFVTVFLAGWISCGVQSYRRTLSSVDYYETLIKDLEKQRKESSDIYEQVTLFNRKESIIRQYGSLESIRIGLRKNPKKMKVQLFLSAVALGPLFNLK